MHIQKRIQRIIILGMCVFMLSFSIFSTCPLTVHAAETEEFDIEFGDISPAQIVDIILNQQGIFLSSSIMYELYSNAISELTSGGTSFLNSIYSVLTNGEISNEDLETALANVADDYLRAYLAFCIKQLGEASSYAFSEISNVITPSSENWVKFALNNGETNTSKSDSSASHGGGGLKSDYTYTLNESVVSDMYSRFKVWYSEDYDNIIFYTRPYSDLFRFYSEVCGTSVNEVGAQAVAFMELYESLEDCYFYVVGSSYTTGGFNGFQLYLLPKSESYFGRKYTHSEYDTDYLSVEYATYFNVSSVDDSVQPVNIFGKYILTSNGFAGTKNETTVYSSLDTWKSEMTSIGVDDFRSIYQYEVLYPSSYDVYDLDYLFYETSQGNYDISTNLTNTVYSKRPERFEISKIDDSNFSDGEPSGFPGVESPLNSDLYTSDVFNIDNAANVVIVNGDYIENMENISHTVINNIIGDSISNGDISSSDNNTINLNMSDEGNNIIINQGNGDIVINYDEEEEPESTATPTPEPTATPTAEPTATPTAEPTATPEIETDDDTIRPTATPTETPTESPSDDDSGSSSSDFSLEEFFNGIKDAIAFILNVIGEVVSLLAGLGNAVLGVLTPLKDLASSFTGLLGSMFTFLPQELMDGISASIYAILLIALWNKFLGGKD